MTPDPPRPRADRRPRTTRPTPDAAPEPTDQIQDAYLKRAVAELGALNDEIGAWAAAHGVRACR